MQGKLRAIVTTALLKDADTRTTSLAWVAAVLQAIALASKPPGDKDYMAVPDLDRTPSSHS